MATSKNDVPRPFAAFDFDLARAVLDQLVEAFDAIPIGALSPDALQHMWRGKGVYQLYLGKQLRYVGKSNNLPGRLSRHLRALSARQNFDVTSLGFKALYIHKNWTTWTTEDAMLRHFGRENLWNTSGFGSNDPGHNREDTAEETTFNNQYPINPDIECTWVGPQTVSAWAILTSLKDKRKLPYLFRFHKVTNKFKRPIDFEAQKQLKETNITIPRANMTVREVLIEVARQLGDGWQATQFKGRLVLYKERLPYNHGTILWPLPGD
jgi:hypothetical protein